MAVTSIGSFLRRRWKLLAAVFCLVMLVQLITFRPTLREYRAEMRFIVGTQPLDSTQFAEEERYYNWVASEYVVAGISDYINGGDFAQQVADDLGHDHDEIDVEVINEVVSAGFERSRLIVAINSADRDLVEPISFAVANALLVTDAQTYSQIESASPLNLPIPQLVRAPAFVYPIDRDLLIERVDQTGEVAAQLAQRVLIALLVGLAIAAVVDFYDPTIRTRQSLEPLSLPIIGEIPAD